MLTDVTQQQLSTDGIKLRGGVFLDDQDLLDVISLAEFVEDHPRDGHYYVGMDGWETIRKNLPGSRQYRGLSEDLPTVHAALLSDGRWLLWCSKTRFAPAYFEVRIPKPTSSDRFGLKSW